MCSSQLSRGASHPAQTTGTSYNLKACQIIFKAVFGKVQVDREDVVKILKKKFGVRHDSLTSLTMTQLMEVTAKKLVNNKYCSIKSGPETNMTSLTLQDITVHKKLLFKSISFEKK